MSCGLVIPPHLDPFPPAISLSCSFQHSSIINQSGHIISATLAHPALSPSLSLREKSSAGQSLNCYDRTGYVIQLILFHLIHSFILSSICSVPCLPICLPIYLPMTTAIWLDRHRALSLFLPLLLPLLLPSFFFFSFFPLLLLLPYLSVQQVMLCVKELGIPQSWTLKGLWLIYSLATKTGQIISKHSSASVPWAHWATLSKPHSTQLLLPF